MTIGDPETTAQRRAIHAAGPTPAAPWRPPTCPHFGPCGGCSWLDVPPAEQLARKRAALATALSPVVGASLPEIESDLPRTRLFDRTKLVYPFGREPAARGEPPRVVAGMFRRGSHAIVDVHSCKIQDRGLTQLANRVRELVVQARLAIHDESTGRGFLRALHMRMAAATGETLVTLVTRGGRFDSARALADAIADASRGLRRSGGGLLRVVGVLRNLNDSRGNDVVSDRFVPLLGRDHLLDHAAGLTFRVSAASFYQVSRRSEALLYAPVLEMAGDLSGQVVVDAYAGVGCFALRLLRGGAARVIALESSSAACADARWNAKRNDLAPRIDIREGPVDALLAALDEPAHLVVVDPPRAGLGAAATAALVARYPERILYVACHASSLARDLRALLAAGYRLTRLRLCDLFPQTERLEAVAELRR